MAVSSLLWPHAPRPSACRAWASQNAGLHDDLYPDPCTRHRRQYRSAQPGTRGFHQPAAVQGCRSAGRDRGASCRQPGHEHSGVGTRVQGLERLEPRVRTHGHLARRRLQPDRRRGTGGDPGRPRLRELPAHGGFGAGGWTTVSGRRRCCGAQPRRNCQRRALAAAVRGRPEHHRTRHHAGRSIVLRRRGHGTAAGIARSRCHGAARHA